MVDKKACKYLLLVPVLGVIINILVIFTNHRKVKDFSLKIFGLYMFAYAGSIFLGVIITVFFIRFLNVFFDFYGIVGNLGSMMISMLFGGLFMLLVFNDYHRRYLVQ